jgi:ubiquinone/menaquinone biosynthesis C-methylase UbiE
MGTGLDYEELKRISDSVSEHRGWDFSRLRSRRDPVPWEFATVVRRYVKPDYRGLEVGTGGGEEFLRVAPSLGVGVGIDADPEMVRLAREKIPPSIIQKVSFHEMYGEDLTFQDGEFDVVLSRHAPVDTDEALRVLGPEGIFITEQVGSKNARNICGV